MAGLDADISSYNQPLPVSPLDVAGKVGGLQQQKLAIDQSKLDQANQALGYMVRAMGSMGPNASKEDYAKAAQNAVDQGLVPQQQENIFLEHLKNAPDSASFYKQFMSAAQEGFKSIEMHTGHNASITNGATDYQGKVNPLTGGFTAATQSAIQPPPTQGTVDNRRVLPTGQPNPDYLQPGIIGPAGPAGPVPVPRMRPKGLPVEPLPAPVSGPTGPTVQTGHDFTQRFAGEPKIVTGAPPGVASAIQTVGEQSGKDYAGDLTRAKNFKADLYPAQAALEGIKELGVQGVGPGTDTLNNIKSAIITWLPNADKKAIDEVGTFEQTRKYLTQIARSSGSTGTNDQLAAAFEANPSIKMSQAATENVLKSVIALRKMQHAQTLLFGQQNLPESEYSKWIARNQNTLDPRAFGFDMMSNEAQRKLIDSIKNDPKAYQKFETSLQFAHDAELIEPKARK